VIACWRKTTGMWADIVTGDNGRTGNYNVRPRRWRQCNTTTGGNRGGSRRSERIERRAEPPGSRVPAGEQQEGASQWVAVGC